MIFINGSDIATRIFLDVLHIHAGLLNPNFGLTVWRHQSITWTIDD